MYVYKLMREWLGWGRTNFLLKQLNLKITKFDNEYSRVEAIKVIPRAHLSGSN